ncbi:VanZ family protein [Neobacillus sp. Marseille-QA0830]
MKNIAIFLWMLLIFVLTCTASFSELITIGEVRFQWETHPQLADLFESMPHRLTNGFLRQKVGHILAFLVFTLLLQRKILSKFLIFIVATSYAAFTEVLQLFFTRDGRVFDIGFDLVGIVLAFGIGLLWVPHSKHIDIKGKQKLY